MANRIDMPPVTVWGRERPGLIVMPPVTVTGRVRPGLSPSDQVWSGYTGRQASDRARRDLPDHAHPTPPGRPTSGWPGDDWAPPVMGGTRGPTWGRPQPPPSSPAVRPPYRPPVFRPAPPPPSPVPYPVDRFPAWTGARPGPAGYRTPAYHVRQPRLGPLTGAVGARAAQYLGPAALLGGLAAGTVATELGRRERQRESARLADSEPGHLFSGAVSIRPAPSPEPRPSPARSRPNWAPPQRGWLDRFIDWVAGD